MRCTDVNSTTQEDGVWWRVDPYTVAAQDSYTMQTLLTYHRQDSKIMLTLPTMAVMPLPSKPAMYRDIMNRILPEGLVVTNRKNRWYLLDLATRVRTPLYEGFTLYLTESGKWAAYDPVPMWDNTGISKPIQRMVKRWAASYDTDDRGTCGLCTWTDDGPLAHTLDEGAMARQHLIDHMLSVTLPHHFMYGIINEVWDHPQSYLIPYKAVTYQLAVTYAYDRLRTPVTIPQLAGAF